MSTPLPSRPDIRGVIALVLLTGCATGHPLTSRMGTTATVRGTPGHYAQSTDSATDGCLGNPACYTQTGDDAIIPWLSRSLDTVRTVTTVMRLLETAELERIEQILTGCAKEAHYQVNQADKVLKGQSPNRDQCREVIRTEGKKAITRAMELGTQKHEMALACARREFARLFTENVSVEPRYQQEPGTGKWLWLDPRTVAEWLRNGLGHLLKGSLVPDIVIHASGNPNKVQRVYDFKFPCPVGNPPSWGQYSRDQPHHPKTQGVMYQEALRLKDEDLAFSTPLGIQR